MLAGRSTMGERSRYGQTTPGATRALPKCRKALDRREADPHYSARGRRRGFSVVELITVVGIVGMLAALLMPALMRARARARRTQCMSNIRQVVLALQSFESSQRVLPRVHYRFPRDYSALAQLLPYLDQQPIYDQINFTLYQWDLYANPGLVQGRVREHAFFGRQRVSVFLCPSDPHSFAGDFGGTNYRQNMGTYPSPSRRSEGPDPNLRGGNGFFFYRGQPSRVTSASVRDGLGHTVAFAERLVGDADPNYYTPASDYANAHAPPGVNWSRSQWIQHCASTGLQPTHDSKTGHWWLYSGWDRTWYNHVLPPNSRIPDCGVNSSGIVTARSWHLGGVNVAVGDGHARFISEKIDLGVWRALGTRAAGEIIDDGSF